MNTEALLVLEDGSLFRGVSIGAEGCAVGEVVFNTAMTGYQEILTDPSYARQLVTLTYPHIGNVGVNPEDVESRGVFAGGLIVRDVPKRFSNFRAKESLGASLARLGTVGIAGIDTRRLTRILRDKGAQRGCIVAGPASGEDRAKKAIEGFPGLMGLDLAREVSTSAPYAWTEGVWRLEPRTVSDKPPGHGLHVVAYDFGVKQAILRLLAERGCRLTVVPAMTSFEDVMALKPDGVFLSNGPGDPEPCVYAVEAIRAFLERGVPLFGICLGHQLLALAAGARTVKMKFGHHGANHPVQALDSGRVFITSQNHGFAVDESSLPAHVKPTHRSLFDGSLQGIEVSGRRAFGFQGHPEASPGPHDMTSLFDRFLTEMNESPAR